MVKTRACDKCGAKDKELNWVHSKWLCADCAESKEETPGAVEDLNELDRIIEEGEKENGGTESNSGNSELEEATEHTEDNRKPFAPFLHRRDSDS